MPIELIRVTTSDGLRLDGSLASPDPAAPSTLGIDAAVLVHGTGSNFYSSTLMDAIAAPLLAAGVAVLRINTRGHDGISTAATATGAVRQGAAFELVDDCRHDLAAWIDFAAQRGFTRPALVGHSLGAVKSIYSLAQPQSPAVVRLVAISPPRLSFSYFASSQHAADFSRVCQQAGDRVAAGRGDELIEIQFPLPYVLTARGYLDKYGPEERYNVLRHLPAVRTPALVTFGTLEVRGNVAFRELPDAVEQIAATTGLDCQVGVIAGADHFYAGVRDELAARIVRWLRRRASVD